MPQADEEEFEVRLLTDPAFGEEFDTVVDEITDEYLQNDLPDEERERVQQYFLSSAERQSKLEFAAELLRRAEAERGKKKEGSKVGVLEQIAAFWRRPAFALTMAGLLVVAGLIYFVVRRDNSTNYLAMNLTISAADRAEGVEPVKVKLPSNTGLRITLAIPENARGGKDYVARIVGGSELKTEQQTQETVTVTIPAGSLSHGTYAIQLFKDKQRIPGSYFFAVE